MADFTHTDLQIVGRHVPDANSGPFTDAQTAQKAGYDTLNPVTGTYEIGVVIEGAFVPLIAEKASLVFDRINAAGGQGNATPQAPAPADEQAQGEHEPPPAHYPQG
jgi:hypothetical protein